MNYTDIENILEKHYSSISTIILSRQDAITGLLPASTAVNTHGDYTDAWVRDNVYSILSVWGLALAYKKYDPSHPRTHILSQSVVKLMRGLLIAMMRQSHKVEVFKHTRELKDALHAKYGTNTGLPVVGDHEWGHLQLDATSLFLLQLAQMIASGLDIIYTIDEVNFVQNLVHYISRTYCTADYGIWERGNKINHGTPEVNGSSVGMAKAALEAMNGFNLFGNSSGNEGVIHVVVNDIARSRFTLQGLLPKESNSKETDGALLSVIGYPAYAIEDGELVERTRKKITTKLEGRYGCKRFLLDGHQSVLEDDSRLHYEPHELKAFENVESEWPLFFTYLLLDALMRGDEKSAQHYRDKLAPLFVEVDGQKLLPELYIVPLELINAEKAEPGSQTRVPNENVPLVWAQSLYMLCEMIDDKVLRTSDIDPLSRREKVGTNRLSTPLVAVIAENNTIKQQLLEQGIKSETLAEVRPLKVSYSHQLSLVHSQLGANEKLGLAGRPMAVARTVTTSYIYKLAGEEVLFLPYYFNPQGFYFNHDNHLLTIHFESSLKFLSRHWDQPGQPLITFFVRDDMMIEKDKELIINLLYKIQNGLYDEVNTIYGSIAQLKNSAGVETIENIHNVEIQDVSSELSQLQYFDSKEQMGYSLDSSKLYHLEQSDLERLVQIIIEDDNRLKTAVALKLLCEREGFEYQLTLDTKQFSLLQIAEIQYERATEHHDWAVVRRLAKLTDKYDDRLEDALMDIIISQKQLAVGRAYDERATFSHPYDTSTIVKTIKEFCGTNTAESILTQEIILHLGHIIRTEPKLFSNILTLRTWYFVQLMVSQISMEQGLNIGASYEYLISLAPYEIYNSLHSVLQSFAVKVDQLYNQEALHAQGTNNLIHNSCVMEQEGENEISDWLAHRRESGLIGHINNKTHKDLWKVLQHTNSFVIGDKYDINSTITQEDVFESTPNERQFQLFVDDKLQRIGAPEYKQLNIELIQALAYFFEENQDLRIEDELVCDVLIGHAVRQTWLKNHEANNYDQERGEAWDHFYHLPPHSVGEAYVEALIYLLQGEAK